MIDFYFIFVFRNREKNLLRAIIYFLQSWNNIYLILIIYNKIFKIIN